ncbi:MAG TPA: hypothetical protein VF087_01635 [Solirubrobacteraceae bacterium]
MAAITGSALTVQLPAASPASTTVLRLKGIGPLHLGMTRTDALATGWLAGRRSGCPLGGTPPITYRFTGAKAPDAIKGSAEFADGRLTTLSFTRGVRTSTGVTVGRTTTARMVARYREAGFTASARYDSTFQGTFVRVRRHGHDVVGGFGQGRVVSIVAIPAVPVCE